MSFSQLSDKLTQRLTYEGNYSSEQKEIIAYGLETALLSIVGLALTIAIGMFTGAWLATVIAVGFGGTLRRLSGGAHFNTPLKCLVFGAAVYNVIGVLANQIATQQFFIPEVLTGILVGVLVVALVITVLYAPVDSEAKPIHSASLRMKLRIASMCFVAGSAITLIPNIPLLAVSATLGILYQSLTLLPMFNQRR